MKGYSKTEGELTPGNYAYRDAVTPMYTKQWFSPNEEAIPTMSNVNPGGLLTDVDKPNMTTPEIVAHIQKNGGPMTRKITKTHIS